MHPEVYPLTFKPPGEGRDQAIEKVFNEVLPRELTKVEKALGKKKFLTGESLSIADFYWGSFYASWLTNPLAYEPERRADTVRKFPKFNAFGMRFTSELSDYLKASPPRPV